MISQLSKYFTHSLRLALKLLYKTMASIEIIIIAHSSRTLNMALIGQLVNSNLHVTQFSTLKMMNTWNAVW